LDLSFQKSGKEIKAAIANRRQQLAERLVARNEALDKFLGNPVKVRSYMVRRSEPNYGHGRMGSVLYGKNDISSEERQEVEQLCQRIFEIEQEIHRLAYTLTHLDDEAVFKLSLDELLSYGFTA
jgi:hypothetical protein